MNFDSDAFLDALSSSLIWEGAKATLILALVTYAGSLVLAVPLAFARSSSRAWLRIPAATWVWLFRGVPLIVMLLFVYNAVPEAISQLEGVLSDPFVAGAVALIITEGAYIAEALRSGLLAVETEQKDAGRALGFTPTTVQRAVVLPIALRVSVPALGNEFISNLKNTSLVSTISMVELTLAGQRAYTQNFAVLETLAAIAALYLLMVAAFSVVQRWAEQKLGKHLRTDGAPHGGETVEAVRQELSEQRILVNEVKPEEPRGTASGTVIEARKVWKSFGRHEVLRGVDLTVRRGEVCVLLGRSGSGKSTLLRCLNRLETPDSGVVLLDGSLLGFREDSSGRTHPLPERAVAPSRKDLGMVFQRFSLFPQMTAWQNVSMAPRTHGRISRRERRDYAMSYLAEVGLASHADKYPNQLSGGQQQRVAIARALAMQPGALLLDEPTSALDPESINEVLLVLQSLAESGKTMVIVSHEMNFARNAASNVTFMADGQIVESAHPRVFFTDPESTQAQAFLTSTGHRG